VRIAAILEFHKRTGLSPGPARQHREMKTAHGKRRPDDFQSRGRSAFLQKLSQAFAICVTNRKTYTGHRRQGVRIPLRITPRYDEAGTRAITVKSSHRLAHLLIGALRYRAGVHDKQIGVDMAPRFLEALSVQTFPDRTAVGLVAATAEGADEELRHCGIS
jgi:hypothetical protein